MLHYLIYVLDYSNENWTTVWEVVINETKRGNGMDKQHVFAASIRF